MRFLMIVKTSGEPDPQATPGAGLMASLAEFRDELARAGALLDGAGLAPCAAGWRIRYDGERPIEFAVPVAEADQTITAYALIQARSPEEAQAWTRRFPNPCRAGMLAEIEVRPLLEPSDTPPASAAARPVDIGH